MQASIATNAAAAAIAALVGLPLGVGVFTTGKSIVAPEISLEVARLEYYDGLFHQHLIPRGTNALRGYWTAEITRGDRQLCSGGGVAPYQGVPISFTPDEWTGGNCPDLAPGDVARATWEYRASNGDLIRVSREIEIKHQ